MKINKHISLFACLLLTFFWTTPSFAEIDLGSIQCGVTNNGQAQMCNKNTHKCIVCKEANMSAKSWRKRILTAGIVNDVEYVFHCVSSDFATPLRCSNAPSGGGESSSETSILGLWKANKQEGQTCIVGNFISMYSACYGCEIVETLASAFVKAAAKGYDLSKQAGNAVLVVCTILWVALFVLKNISSFATVEPRKMVQELLVQFFKIMVAFIVINAGIQTILHYTLVPLVTAGTDFADAITLTFQTYEGSLAQ